MRFLPRQLSRFLVFALVVCSLWLEQLKVIGFTLCLTVGGTVVLACIVNSMIGLRTLPDVERQGLDLTKHGEEGRVET